MAKEIFAIKNEKYILHIRAIEPEDGEAFFFGSGHMYRELGAENWSFSRQPLEELIANNEIYDINDPAVNPTCYVSSAQHWANDELKRKIQNKRNNHQTETTIRIKKSKQETMLEVLETKKREQNDLKISIAWDKNMKGTARNEDLRLLDKLNKGIAKLQSQLESN